MKNTRPHNSPKWFPLHPGRTFIKRDAPYSDGTKPEKGKANKHPFIVIRESETMVECVMAQTLKCLRENKDKSFLVNPLDGRSRDYYQEIDDPHPPMDSNNEKKYGIDARRQYLDLRYTVVFAKEDLFNSTKIDLCHDGGSGYLGKKDLSKIMQGLENCQKARTRLFDKNRRLMNDKEWVAQNQPELLTQQKSGKQLPSKKLTMPQSNQTKKSLSNQPDSQPPEQSNDTGAQMTSKKTIETPVVHDITPASAETDVQKYKTTTSVKPAANANTRIIPDTSDIVRNSKSSEYSWNPYN